MWQPLWCNKKGVVVKWILKQNSRSRSKKYLTKDGSSFNQSQDRSCIQSPCDRSKDFQVWCFEIWISYLNFALYSLFQKNGYTFATVYNSKCVTVFLKQTSCINGQIYGEDFAKFCGLLRIYELYKNRIKMAETIRWLEFCC